MGRFIQKIKLIITKPLLKGCEGASLTAILISLAIFSISAVGITSALTHTAKTQNDVAIKTGAGKFQDVLRSELAKTIRNFMIDDCTGARFGNTTNPLSQAFGNLTISNLDGGGTASLSYTTNPVALAEGHKAAASRCRTPRKGLANSAQIGSGEYSYFCMKFNANTSYLSQGNLSAQSFWKLPETFMEVLIIPVQLQSDTPILCQNVDSAAQGAKVIYSIYYANKVAGSSKNSVLYSGQRIDGLFYVSGEP